MARVVDLPVALQQPAAEATPAGCKKPRVRTVGVNEQGRRIGHGHPRAKLTDYEVDLIRNMYDEGGWSYATLADKFEVSKATIADLVKCRRRAQVPAGYRKVCVKG